MDGYLSDAFNKNIYNLRNQYKTEYEIADKIGELLYYVAETYCIKGTEQRNVYVTASIIQIYKYYQSSIILLERGLNEAAFSLVRSMIELSFKIIEVIRNKNSLYKIILKEQFEEKSILNYLKEKELYNLVDKETLNKKLEEIDKVIEGKKKPKKETSIYTIGDNNELYDAYAVYKYNCDYVHLSTRTIMEKVEFNKDGIFINSNPEFKNFKENINFIITIPLFILPYIVEYVNTEDVNKKFNRINKRIEEYMGQ